MFFFGLATLISNICRYPIKIKRLVSSDAACINRAVDIAIFSILTPLFFGVSKQHIAFGVHQLVNGCYYYYLASLRSQTPNFLYAMRLFLVAKMLVTQGSDNGILTGVFLQTCLTVNSHEFETNGRLRVYESLFAERQENFIRLGI